MRNQLTETMTTTTTIMMIMMRIIMMIMMMKIKTMMKGDDYNYQIEAQIVMIGTEPLPHCSDGTSKGAPGSRLEW